MNNLIKNFLYFLPVLIILLFLLSTFLSWPLSHGFYPDLLITQSLFGKNIDLLPISKFFQHYAMQFGSLGILYKIFAFNAWAYFALSISLKILAAFSIFHFTYKWSKSKLAAIIASLFFGVNTAGIQSTIDVTLIQIYVAIIVLMIFLDRWFTFHYHPNKNNLIQSIAFFVLTILSYPERMVGIVFLVIPGEFYWFISRYKNTEGISIKAKHFLLLMIALIVLIFVTGSLKPPEEFASKRVSTIALLLSLFTGSHVTIPGIFSFIGNLLIPGVLFTFHSTLGPITDIQIMTILSYCTPLIGIIFLIICLMRRKFLLAFVSTIAVIFSPGIFLYKYRLIDWSQEWILLAQVGGSLFLLLNLIILSVWKNNRRIAELGLLGSALVLSNLLLPWLITPQFLPSQSQSAFNFVHRYYTLPSVGMGIILGSVSLISIQLIHEGIQIVMNRFRKLTILQLLKILIINGLASSVFIPVIFIILLQFFATQKHLIGEYTRLNPYNADPQHINSFWTKLNPKISNFNPNGESVIYIEQDNSLSEKYITAEFPERLRFHFNLTTTPKLKFIFERNQLIEYFKDNYEITKLNSFYAFKWRNNSLIDIKEELLKSL